MQGTLGIPSRRNWIGSGKFRPLAAVCASLALVSYTAIASSGFSISSLFQAEPQTQSVTTHDLTLRWGSVTGATHYRLEQSTDNGVTYTPLSPIALTSQTLTLADGQYKFKVSGCIEDVANSLVLCDGIGEYSNEYFYDTANPPTNNATLDWAQMGGTTTSAPLASKTVPSTNFYGATPGEAGVSGGAAVYTLPVVVPPGRNGMQPQVSLGYSSRSGNGIAGVGWNLSAGSAISRCPATVAQDGFTAGVDYSNTDRLCLDGQRLMVVSGTYGATGAEYRTEIESLVKVVQSGGYNAATSDFTVHLPNGARRFYGLNTQSRVTATGKSAPISWLIEREEDAGANNHMSYSYTNYGDGEVLLSSIKYTGNGTTDGNREVVFGYQDRAKYSTQYMSGGKTRTTKRLSLVSTWYAGSKIRDYTLNYGVASTASGRSLLRSVTECGYEGVNELCREPTTFEWLENKPRFEVELFATSSGTEVYPPYNDTFGGQVVHGIRPFNGDLNGDGVRDWRGSTIDGQGKPVSKVRMVNAEGQQLAESDTDLQTCRVNSHTLGLSCVSADFNLDGRTDSWKEVNNKLVIGYTEESSPGVYTINWSGTTDVPIRHQDSNGPNYNVVHSGDYNGDGWPDVVVQKTTNYANGFEAEIFLHLHTKNLTTPYLPETTPIFNSGVNTGIGSTFEFVGDMNGDGLPDLTMSTHFYNQVQPALTDLFLTKVNAGAVSFERHNINFDNVADLTDGHFSYLMDVNGDGLNDWLGWIDFIDLNNPSPLIIKMNKGDGTFAPNINTGVNIAPFAIKVPNPATGQEVERYNANKLDLFQVMDIDNNGTVELLIPGTLVAEYCHDYKDFGPTGSNLQTKTICGDNITGTAYYPADNGVLQIFGYQTDKSIRKLTAWHFDESGLGNISIRTEVTDILSAGVPGATTVLDAFGKGLQDVIFEYGCQSSEGCTMSPALAGSALAGKAVNHVYVNRNYGATENTGTLSATDFQPVDMLKSAQNGVGTQSNWTHRPLSSDQYNTTYASFYQTNFPEVVDGEPRGKQIHFASSMYSVAEFAQSNGVGGLNSTRYQYDGAVYDIQGRGFRGFNGITEINEFDATSGTTTYTDFKQTFPFSSAVEAQYVFEGIDVDVDNPLEQSQALTETTNEWLLNPSQNNIWKSLGVHQLYNKEAYSINRTPSTDVSGKGAKISESWVRVKLNGDIDQYGNINNKETELKDKYGSYVTVEEADFSLASDDWPNRYESRTVTRKAVNRTIYGISTVPVDTDNNKVVKTEVTWNATHRKPGTVVVKKDAVTEITTTSMVYNDYGLPTQVTVTGDVIEGSTDTSTQQVRKTTTNYTNNGMVDSIDGYFPYEITQYASATNLHVTTTQTDARTGLPASVNDVAGVVTSTVYDKLARPITINRTGFPAQQIRYLSKTGDANAPTHAVMSIQTVQEGVPNSLEYKDLLGRTLRTATESFASTELTPEYIFQDVKYDNRGLVTEESNPYIAPTLPVSTIYSGHDVLGRVQSKVTPQTNGQLNTTYSYNGLTTDITVVATHSDVGNLIMSRTYNALEQLVETVDANVIPGVTQYAYDGAGNPIVIRDANNNDIVASYDALGRKTYVDDPNQGITNFTYNDFGELEKEVDANGDIIRYDMDWLGRVDWRNGNGELATFNWDFPIQKGLLVSQTQGASSKSYLYDSAARITQSDVVIDGTTYQTLTEYDNNHGRPLSMTYPGRDLATQGIKVEYLYNATGYLTQERNANTQFVYREVTAQDAFGNIKNANLNGSTLTGEYNYHGTSGQMLHSKVQAGASVLHHLGYTLYDSYGNLKTQENYAPDFTQTPRDTFTYDKLHRLTQSGITVNGLTANIDYAYDAVGNILKKSDYSANAANAYTYSNGTNQIASIVLKDSGGTVTFGYDNKGNQTHRNSTQEVTYNVFNKPLTINKNGSNIALSYGADLARYKQTRVVDGKTIVTHYIDKHYEVEIEGTNYTRKSYLGDVAIFTDSDTDGITISYTHRDRLGSAATFTDHNNIVKARRHFDPFGKPRGGDWSELMPPQLNANLLDTIMDTRRGFTDHEHLDEAELIHMNGRVYDYNVGRFMSVDPFIQSPANSQSINPYSYIMNNPMSGTDPSGYESECGLGQAGCSQSTEVEVSKAGSRIKQKVTVTATTNEDGSVSVSVSGSNGAVNSISIESVGAGINSAVDIASELQKAKRDAVINQHVYGEGEGDLESVGVIKVSDSKLDELGIDKTIFEDVEGESGFKSGLYQDTNSGEYIYAFAGTDGLNRADWATNFAEGVGIYSRQHALAVEATQHLVDKLVNKSLSLTGHSLGGGLASLAALKFNLNARTFNAAGLSESTKEFHDIRGASESNIQAYYVKGEILSFSQHLGITPEKLGNKIGLRSTRVHGFPGMLIPTFSLFNRGRMHTISSVVWALNGK